MHLPLCIFLSLTHICTSMKRKQTSNILAPNVVLKIFSCFAKCGATSAFALNSFKLSDLDISGTKKVSDEIAKIITKIITYEKHVRHKSPNEDGSNVSVSPQESIA